MFANLIKNAIEASPINEKITICIEENEHVIIQIHNKGVVPEEIRDKFFEKYITWGKTSGTGLGTYSAKLIAEIQEGKISLRSTETEGTTIKIQLHKATGKPSLLKDEQEIQIDNIGYESKSLPKNKTYDTAKIKPIFKNLLKALNDANPVDVNLL